MAKIVDLDAIALSPAAVMAWAELAWKTAQGLEQIARNRGIELQIPDEQARENNDGTLTIFVKIPGIIDISLDVPADQWAYIQ